MADIEFDEWMSQSDAVLWHIERDPLLRSTIVSVWRLDSLPTQTRMDAVVDRMIRNLPRMSQRVVDDPTGLATPRWVHDQHFDRAHHYRRVRLPGDDPGDEALLQHAQQLAGRSFDKDRPLWELHVVEGLTGGAGALVFAVHHAIADGLGMVNMLQHMVDLDPDGSLGSGGDEGGSGDDTSVPSTPETAVATAGRAVSRRVAQDARAGLRVGKATMRTASSFLRDPIGSVRGAARTTSSIADVVKPAPRPLSALLAGRSMSPTFATITIPLDEMKSAAKSVGGSLNDAFVACVLDGLDRYHRLHGSPADEIRMAMPISIRTEDTAGQTTNQFVPARTVLPLGAADPAERLGATKARLTEVRNEPALHHVDEISAIIGRLGPSAAVTIVGGMMKGVDITTSNVPGPPFPVWVAGSRVEEFYAFGPLAGAAINITLFSYDGTLHLGINTDAKAVADLDGLVESLRDAVADTLALA